MNCTCGTSMRDWSYYLLSEPKPHERIPHFYCPVCQSHYHQTRFYTRDEWFFFINEETYRNYQQRMACEYLDSLESPHAHELINHSNPEGDIS